MMVTAHDPQLQCVADRFEALLNRHNGQYRRLCRLLTIHYLRVLTASYQAEYYGTPWTEQQCEVACQRADETANIDNCQRHGPSLPDVTE